MLKEFSDNIHEIDFHVHTPESSCYNRKNKNIDDDYKDFLLSIAKSGLNVICITDHNSIKGYKKLLEIEQKVQNDLKLFERMKLSLDKLPEDLENEYDTLKIFNDIFDNVYFLPGIEFTTQEQIHMLIIFNDEINLEKIEQFLFDGGYSADNQGKDYCDVLSKWTVISLLDEVSKSFNENAIVIAAHVDRTKGIWEALDNSIYKAKIFQHNKLAGISYNSPSTREVIKQVLKNPEYKRDGIPPAFLQCSDFHNNEDQVVGIPKAYIKIDQLSFRSIYKAFTNPDEYIFSPAPPKTMEIVNELANNPCNYILPSISNEEEVRLVVNAVCAYSNSNYGNVVIGLNQKKEPIGVDVTDKGIKSLLDKISESITPTVKINLVPYEYGKRKIISIRVSKGNANLYLVSDIAYFFSEENSVIIANPNEIALHIENKLYEKYSKILVVNKKRLQKVSDMLLAYSDGLEVMQYLNFIDKNTIALHEVVELDIIGRSVYEEIDTHYFNEDKDGNAIILHSMNPRLKGAVCRFTPPIFNLDDSVILKTDAKKFSGNKVIIGSEGYVHYDENNNIPILIDDQKALVLKINKKYKEQISEKFLSAYLKSTALLYYSYICNDSTNIFLPECYNGLRVPSHIQPEQKLMVENLVDEITFLESIFIEKASEICKDCRQHDDTISCKIMEELVNDHNSKVNVIMETIDKHINSILMFDEDTQSHINRSLEIFLPEEF